MRATVAADDTKPFFLQLLFFLSRLSFRVLLFGFNAMCDDVACLFWNRCIFFNSFFPRLILSAQKCELENNLGNIKFVYSDAHYLAASQ